MNEWDFSNCTDEELLEIEGHLNALHNLGFDIFDECEQAFKEEFKKRKIVVITTREYLLNVVFVEKN
jgi:hypothetical protein